MDFEWDEEKRVRNLEKHRIDFDLAILFFDGRPTRTWESSYTDEIRFITTVNVDVKYVTVVWTPRDGVSPGSSHSGEHDVQKSKHLVKYTSQQIKEMRDRGEFSEPDWDYLDSMTEEKLEALIDVEEEGMPIWDSMVVDFPQPKRQLTVRFDGDVIDWFKAQGPGYQTRMNAVLRSYVESRKRSA